MSAGKHFMADDQGSIRRTITEVGRMRLLTANHEQHTKLVALRAQLFCGCADLLAKQEIFQPF